MSKLVLPLGSPSCQKEIRDLTWHQGLPITDERRCGSSGVLVQLSEGLWTTDTAADQVTAVQLKVWYLSVRYHGNGMFQMLTASWLCALSCADVHPFGKIKPVTREAIHIIAQQWQQSWTADNASLLQENISETSKRPKNGKLVKPWYYQTPRANPFLRSGFAVLWFIVNNLVLRVLQYQRQHLIWRAGFCSRFLPVIIGNFPCDLLSGIQALTWSWIFKKKCYKCRW